MKLRAIEPGHLSDLALVLVALAVLSALDRWYAPWWSHWVVLGVMVLVWIGVAVAFRSEDWGDPDEADL